jgi:hypothetical protein
MSDEPREAPREEQRQGPKAREFGDPTQCMGGTDGVKFTGRFAALTVSLALTCIVIAIFADGWVKVKDPTFFANHRDRAVTWSKLGFNGSATEVELGLRKYCVTFRDEVTTSDSFLPPGRVCSWYTEGIDATFGTATEEHALNDIFGYSIIESINIAVQILWITFGVGFIGALFSEKKCCALAWSIFLVLGTALPMVIGRVVITILEDDISAAGGDPEVVYAQSFYACLAGFIFSALTCIAATLACTFTAGSEISDLEELGDGSDIKFQTRNFTEYGYMNDQIELVGRLGSALGQLGWILYLIAIMEGTWITTDELGGVGVTPASIGFYDYGLGNTTEAIFGLQQWCVKGLVIFDPNGNQIMEDQFNCYDNDQKLGLYDVDICDITSHADMCSNFGSAMLAICAGYLIGILADWFSDKMAVQGALHIVACACGIYACFETSATYNGDTFEEMVGSDPTLGDGIGLVIGGIFCFGLGSICSCLDNFNTCRPSGKYSEASFCQKLCVCGKMGHAELYSEDGAKVNKGGQCECCYGNQRVRGKVR